MELVDQLRGKRICIDTAPFIYFIEKDVFPTLIGKQFFAFPQEAKFIDIGTPSSYKEAETFFM